MERTYVLNFIFKVMAAKFEELFKEYQPNFTRKDFYEREISAAGIMRTTRRL